ncbi:MAG: shikimate dehydrogenase [Nitrospirota bacterium]
MTISGRTKVTGLFGYPVGHSLSPAMHNAAFSHLNLDYCYVTFNVRPELLREAVHAIRALSLSGVNVTIPHKENVIPFLDRVDEEALFIGAVNTIKNSDGTLIGYNTDGRGFMESLKEAAIDPEGKRVMIIGAGGASRAASFYLAKKASQVLIYDIDKTKAGKLAADLNTVHPNVAVMDKPDSLHGIDILINATPLGLKETDLMPVDISLITAKTAVCDLIYKKTTLLRMASDKGCITLDGSGMLLHQGALAFKIWTGIKPPISVMRDALEGSKSNR